MPPDAGNSTMSWQALVWATKQTGLPPAQKLVLLCLADHAAHEGGSAYPGLDRIRKWTGLSERTVQRALVEMTDRTLIEVEEEGGGRKGGRGLATSYRLPVLTDQKGVIVTPFPAPGSDERVPNVNEKGVTMTPQPKIEPKSQNRSLRSRAERDVDDADFAWLVSEAEGYLAAAGCPRRQIRPLLSDLVRRFDGVDGAWDILVSSQNVRRDKLVPWLVGLVRGYQRPTYQGSQAQQGESDVARWNRLGYAAGRTYTCRTMAERLKWCLRQIEAERASNPDAANHPGSGARQ